MTRIRIRRDHLHPAGCRCCKPRGPADRRGCAAVAALILLGMPIGTAATALADHLLAGPGLQVILGQPKEHP